MENKEEMKSYWKIDEFFNVFGNLLDMNLKENNIMDLLKVLFYHDYFSNDNEKKSKI